VFSHFFFSKNKTVLIALMSLCAHAVLFIAVQDVLPELSRPEEQRAKVVMKLIEAVSSGGPASEAAEPAETAAAAAPAEPLPSPAPAEKAVPAETPAAVTEEAVPEPAEQVPPEEAVSGPAIEETAELSEAGDVPAENRVEGAAGEAEGPVILGPISTVSAGPSEDTSAAPRSPLPGNGAAAAVAFDSIPGSADLPKPAYPEMAKRWGHEGTVVVEITIRAGGRVESAELLASSGYGELDEAAVDVVLNRWRFEGIDEKTVTVKQFEFRLRGR
jgi:periplasmic protein TonB